MIKFFPFQFENKVVNKVNYNLYISIKIIFFLNLYIINNTSLKINNTTITHNWHT